MWLSPKVFSDTVLQKKEAKMPGPHPPQHIRLLSFRMVNSYVVNSRSLPSLRLITYESELFELRPIAALSHKEYAYREI
jgi:hypothetical protein